MIVVKSNKKIKYFSQKPKPADLHLTSMVDYGQITLILSKDIGINTEFILKILLLCLISLTDIGVHWSDVRP